MWSVSAVLSLWCQCPPSCRAVRVVELLSGRVAAGVRFFLLQFVGRCFLAASSARAGLLVGVLTASLRLCREILSRSRADPRAGQEGVGRKLLWIWCAQVRMSIWPNPRLAHVEIKEIFRHHRRSNAPEGEVAVLVSQISVLVPGDVKLGLLCHCSRRRHRRRQCALRLHATYVLPRLRSGLQRAGAQLHLRGH